MNHYKDVEYWEIQPSDPLLSAVSNTLGISVTTITKLARELIPIARELSKNGCTRH